MAWCGGHDPVYKYGCSRCKELTENELKRVSRLPKAEQDAYHARQATMHGAIEEMLALDLATHGGSEAEVDYTVEVMKHPKYGSGRKDDNDRE